MVYGRISKTASALPKKKVDNQELTGFLTTSDEWIRERTGIESRHVATSEDAVSLGIETARKLVEGRDPAELDFVIVTTMSAEQAMPAVAASIQGAIGAKNALAFDLNSACSGFVVGLSVAESLFNSGQAKTGLLISTETMSTMLDWGDRRTAILFGDGAGGVLLTAACTPMILASKLQSAGDTSQVLTSGYPNAHYSEHDESKAERYLQMDGRAVMAFTMKSVREQIQSLLDENRLSASALDFLLLHQANRRIQEKIAQKLGITPEKCPSNIAKIGNTSSASLPILLDDLAKNGELRFDGTQKTLLAGFGGGLTWGSMLLTL